MRNDPAEIPCASETALADEVERYRSLFAYSPHGVFSLDLAGSITAANEAMQQLIGYSERELLGTHFHDITHPHEIKAADQAFLAIMERHPQLFESRIVTATGEVREVKVAAVPVVVSDAVVGVHGITEDVTDANKMRRDLVEANAAKTLFLANVSHEIRTPISVVIGATEMLLEPDLDPGHQDRLIGMVHRNGHQLQRLVNDLLDFSRLKVGKMSIDEAPFELVDIIDDHLEWAQPRASGRGLALNVSLDASVPLTVQGDAVCVAQVLTNLVDNALRFTESGRVHIAIGMRPTTSPARMKDAWVEFAVSDTGVGIAAEHVESLFESFTQVDATATRVHGGLGLGLAICCDLVDAMRGELKVRSTPGAGSTFTVALPLVALADGRAAAPRPGTVDAPAVAANVPYRAP